LYESYLVKNLRALIINIKVKKLNELFTGKIHLVIKED